MPQISRCSGIIMHISSLPSPYGIGTLGKCACEFADFLHESGQRIWQLLPLGPTGFSNSPYQSFSSFAGNPYLIDLDAINTVGLDLNSYYWGSDPTCVDFGALYKNRYKFFREFFKNCTIESKIESFARENSHWLPDYALFMALKRHFEGCAWYNWPFDIRSRTPSAVEHYTALLQDEIQLEYFIQYHFLKQFSDLRDYCRKLGILLMGDLPIYAAPDSADVWANPQEFHLDDEFLPTEVAGVPPDYFSETGQLWGNPLYRWADMKDSGYSFWKKRIGAAAKLYDIVRLDHFRGFESYWSVKRGRADAVDGKWNPGPGEYFIDAIHSAFPDTIFVAEDLGLITDEVRQLKDYAGFPGMAVLSFAFDPDGKSSYLPHRLEKNCFCYTGTHDNAPMSVFTDELDDKQLDFINSYCGGPENIIRSGMESAARVFIAQMQDWLKMGAESRMNTPGTSEGCWTWRLTTLPSPELSHEIYEMTLASSRCSKKEDTRL